MSANAALSRKIRSAQAGHITKQERATPATPAQRAASYRIRNAEELAEMRANANAQNLADRTIRDGGGEDKANGKATGELLLRLMAQHPDGDPHVA